MQQLYAQHAWCHLLVVPCIAVNLQFRSALFFVRKLKLIGVITKPDQVALSCFRPASVGHDVVWYYALRLVVDIVNCDAPGEFHSSSNSVPLSTSCQPLPLWRSFTHESSACFSASVLHPSPLFENMHCNNTSGDDFQTGTPLSLVLQRVPNKTAVLISQTAAGRLSQRRSVLINCLVSHAVPMTGLEVVLGAVRILEVLLSICFLWKENRDTESPDLRVRHTSSYVIESHSESFQAIGRRKACASCRINTKYI